MGIGSSVGKAVTAIGGDSGTGWVASAVPVKEGVDAVTAHSDEYDDV